MRVVGDRQLPGPGMNGPSASEVAASQEIAMAAPRVVPKGVYRYRSHAEAEQDARRWAVNGMVEKNLELAGGSSFNPKIR